VPPGLDPGIELAVRVLMEAGVETFESCEGGAAASNAMDLFAALETALRKVCRPLLGKGNALTDSMLSA
jgi:hypothetical protein